MVLNMLQYLDRQMDDFVSEFCFLMKEIHDSANLQKFKQIQPDMCFSTHENKAKQISVKHP